MKTEQEIRKELEDHQTQDMTAELNWFNDRDGMNYVKGYINALKFVLDFSELVPRGED